MPKRRTRATKTKRSKTSKRKPRSKVRRRKNKTNRRITVRRIAVALSVLLVIFIAYSFYLDFKIRTKFEGKRWALPAKVYARPLELYAGLALTPAKLLYELRLLGYKQTYNFPQQEGVFMQEHDEFILVTRPFLFSDGLQSSAVIKIRFSDHVIEEIYNFSEEQSVDLMRLEPAVIGGIYPAHNEDRVLVKLEDVPDNLKQAIIAVEDRNFYIHHGVDLRAIARALYSNVRAGGTVQGGSTLTQQLIKNYFLTNKRSLWRKINEAIMSVLIELHYDKNEILEAYINEIYLGQDRQRAIHGFGLASQYYFNKNVSDLNLNEAVVLVALIRGPSYYDPNRHPKRLLKRRNLVFKILEQQDIISARTQLRSSSSPLGINYGKPGFSTANPGYIHLVKRQLRQYYRDSDLTSEGLKIFTNMDPWVQKELASSISRQLRRSKRFDDKRDPLQIAAIISDTNTGSVLALQGGRKASYAGFNRAIDARRPIGSLIKPAIYLSALRSQKYSVLSMLSDKTIRVRGPNNKTWQPDNYDEREHGDVPFYYALTKSFNLATVRLGLDVGYELIAKTLNDLGIKRPVPAYPSMLLGSLELTPLEVATMYQTFASSGFRTPLLAIRGVMTGEGDVLSRFPVNVVQTINSENVVRINSILQNVAKTGTAKKLAVTLPSLHAAGKTGTTNDLRDSWFAGFTGGQLGVVWMGADKNRSTGLTGASGALNVWLDTMKNIDTPSLSLSADDSIIPYTIVDGGVIAVPEDCDNVVELFVSKNTKVMSQDTCAIELEAN